MSHAEFRRQSQAGHARKVAGIKGDRDADKAMVASAIAQHESNDHPGEPKTRLKLATGGVADDGETMAKPRLDRPGKSGKGATVNVIVAPAPQKVPVPVPVPAAAPPAMAAPKPPMPMPAAGGPPGGMPPRPPVAAAAPPMMPRRNGGRAGFATGGAVMHAGSHSGPGRIEKAELQKRATPVPSMKDGGFIKGAIKHPGAERAAAAKAGMSTKAYMEEHKGDSGTAGKRARLGLTLEKLRK